MPIDRLNIGGQGQPAFAKGQPNADSFFTYQSAVDMAIWDALGQTLDLPVTELLGGYTDRTRVSHMLRFDTPAAMVDEATKMREEFTAVPVHDDRGIPARAASVGHLSGVGATAQLEVMDEMRPESIHNFELGGPATARTPAAATSISVAPLGDRCRFAASRTSPPQGLQPRRQQIR